MRICLVDDDSTQLEYLKLIIEKWANKSDIDTHINYYHSAEEMLFENNESYPFDMIILDIQMGKINGIELAKRIRKTDKKVTIAFVSGMADYVFEGYEVQAVRYLLKPIQADKVNELLDHFVAHKSKERKYFILSVFGEKKKIYYDDIVYFEARGHYVVFHLETNTYEYKYNISDICNELPVSDFIRTHRSYVVNIKYIERVTKSDCQLINNLNVPLSRNSYKDVNEKFIQYHKGRDK